MVHVFTAPLQSRNIQKGPGRNMLDNDGENKLKHHLDLF